ncbi:MAG TPA: ATP-binding protein, partial [Pricia sp.]|nr:ATP-binding protein [Pricia sp.]
PLPAEEERLQLWKQTLPEKIKISSKVNIKRIADKYELTGANVVNIVQQICLEHLATGNSEIIEKNFVDAIRKEFGKEGKML